MDSLEAEIITALEDAKAYGLDLANPATGSAFVALALEELKKERKNKTRPVGEILAAVIDQLAPKAKEEPMNQNESELQKSYDQAAARLRSKGVELQQTKTQLGEVISRLVDTTEPKERAALIAKRAELVNLCEVFSDELGELQSRADAAYLKIFIYREQQANQERARLGEIARQKRLAVGEIEHGLRLFQNSEGYKPPTDENVAKLTSIKQRLLAAQAESQIAGRNAERAAEAWKKAKQALEETRVELGVTQNG